VLADDSRHWSLSRANRETIRDLRALYAGTLQPGPAITYIASDGGERLGRDRAVSTRTLVCQRVHSLHRTGHAVVEFGTEQVFAFIVRYRPGLVDKAFDDAQFCDFAGFFRHQSLRL